MRLYFFWRIDYIAGMQFHRLLQIAIIAVVSLYVLPKGNAQDSPPKQSVKDSLYQSYLKEPQYEYVKEPNGTVRLEGDLRTPVSQLRKRQRGLALVLGGLGAMTLGISTSGPTLSQINAESVILFGAGLLGCGTGGFMLLDSLFEQEYYGGIGTKKTNSLSFGITPHGAGFVYSF